MSTGDEATVLDSLLELEHDLGKYIAMPLGFLEDDAGPEAVRTAMRAALLETRRTSSGVRSARAIWGDFVATLPDDWRVDPRMLELGGVVEDVLALEEQLEAGWTRGEALSRVQRVRSIIRQTIDHLKGRGYHV